MDSMFESSICHQLHSHADTEEGTAAPLHCLLQRVAHALDGTQPAHAITERALAGQDDAVGAADFVSVGGDPDRGFEPGLAGSALESLCGRTQVARPIIHDGDGPGLDAGAPDGRLGRRI
jgi:hypothetical protein